MLNRVTIDPTIGSRDLFGETIRPREPHPVRRSRITNRPTARADQDTAAGRRLADLIRGFLAEMGNPCNSVAQADAIRAAELTCAAEDARARLLAGDGDCNAVAQRAEGKTSIDDVVKIERLARHAVRKLGLRSAANAQPPRDIMDLIA